MRNWAAAGLVVIAACRGASHSETQLELWAMGSEGELVQNLLPAFNQQNPGTTVRVQQIPWSAAHEKLLTAYVAGTLPDVIQLGNTWLPELVAIGAVQPLDAGLDSMTRDDCFAGILDTNVIDGKTYGMPWYVDTRVLFYRSDLLAEAGYARAPRSWDEWLDAMQRLRNQGLGRRYPIFVPLSEWQLPVALAFENQAQLLRDDSRYGNFRSPEFRRAFTFFAELFRNGLAPFSGEAQIANIYQDFAAGFFTFYVSGPWNLSELRRRFPPQLAGAWATAPLPGLHADRPGISLAGGSSLALVRGTPRRDLAWKLIRFLTEPQQQVAFYKLSGDLPARRSAWDQSLLRDDPHAQAFRAQLEHVRATPKIPEWERIAQLLTRYSEAVVRRKLSIEAALADLDADTDAVLEKRRWMMDRAARHPASGVRRDAGSESRLRDGATLK